MTSKKHLLLLEDTIRNTQWVESSCSFNSKEGRSDFAWTEVNNLHESWKDFESIKKMLDAISANENDQYYNGLTGAPVVITHALQPKKNGADYYAVYLLFSDSGEMWWELSEVIRTRIEAVKRVDHFNHHETMMGPAFREAKCVYLSKLN